MAWRRGNRLRLVPEHDAEGQTREIYEDTKITLGLPHVSLIFQCYAAYPPFLEMQWTRLRPLLETRAFFDLAERLRADAYTRMYNYFDIPDLSGHTGDSQDEIKRVVELFQYANPLLLLIEAAQFQAFDSAVGQAAISSPPESRFRFGPPPILVDEAEASSGVRKLFGEFKRTMDMPFVGTTFRALARWPEFLKLYWDVLRGVALSPMYQECGYGVADTAWALARELPGRFELTVNQLTEAGMQDENIASVVRTTELFFKSLSRLTLDVAVAKIALEGGTQKAPPQPAPAREIQAA